MAKRYGKKPLAGFEHGTRIHAPSAGEPRFCVVGVDRASGERIFFEVATGELARAKARELERFGAPALPVRGPAAEGPRTVGRLAEDYVGAYLAGTSVRCREKQEYLLRRWVLGDRLVAPWTSAESEAILVSARHQGRSAALVQDVGAVMRALVTHARRRRWPTAQGADPVWLVGSSKKAGVRGASAAHVARSTLPTDDRCAALFAAVRRLGEPRWALAVRSSTAPGCARANWSPCEPETWSPPRRASSTSGAEQPRAGPPTLKLPKNGRTRTAVFPQSLADDLLASMDEVHDEAGPEGLRFPGRRGRLVRRTVFPQPWVKSADAAGWPMTEPLRRSRGYGEKDEGWRWLRAARWSPHDLRHVAACWMRFDVGLDPAGLATASGGRGPGSTPPGPSPHRGGAALRRRGGGPPRLGRGARLRRRPAHPRTGGQRRAPRPHRRGGPGRRGRRQRARRGRRRRHRLAPGPPPPPTPPPGGACAWSRPWRRRGAVVPVAVAVLAGGRRPGGAPEGEHSPRDRGREPRAAVVRRVTPVLVEGPGRRQRRRHGRSLAPGRERGQPRRVLRSRGSDHRCTGRSSRTRPSSPASAPRPNRPVVERPGDRAARRSPRRAPPRSGRPTSGGARDGVAAQRAAGSRPANASHSSLPQRSIWSRPAAGSTMRDTPRRASRST